MIKILLISIFLFSCVGTSFSQSARLVTGLRSSFLNYINIQNSLPDYKSYKEQRNMYVGVEVDMYSCIDSIVTIYSGMSYFRNGEKFIQSDVFTDPNSFSVQDFYLDYFGAMIGLNIEPLKNKRVIPYFGIQLNYSRQIGRNMYSKAIQEAVENTGVGFFNTNLIGYSSVVGVEYPMKRFSFGLRWTYLINSTILYENSTVRAEYVEYSLLTTIGYKLLQY